MKHFISVIPVVVAAILMSGCGMQNLRQGHLQPNSKTPVQVNGLLANLVGDRRHGYKLVDSGSGRVLSTFEQATHASISGHFHPAGADLVMLDTPTTHCPLRKTILSSPNGRRVETHSFGCASPMRFDISHGALHATEQAGTGGNPPRAYAFTATTMRGPFSTAKPKTPSRPLVHRSAVSNRAPAPAPEQDENHSPAHASTRSPQQQHGGFGTTQDATGQGVQRVHENDQRPSAGAKPHVSLGGS